MIKAVDFSAWTGEIQDEDWNDLWDMGVRLAIVQAFGGGPGAPTGGRENPHAQQQLAGAEKRGMWLAAYTWPSWAWPHALANLGSFVPKLQALALDVEAGCGVHPDQIVDLRARNVRPMIYASGNTWSTIMGRSSYVNDFKDVLLWAAYYPYRGVWNGVWQTNVQEGMKYQVDGWTRCAGWQFAGTTTLSDETWDLSVFEDDFILPSQPSEVEVLRQEIVRLKDQLNVADGRLSKRLSAIRSLENMMKQTGTLSKAVTDALLGGRPYNE